MIGLLTSLSLGFAAASDGSNHEEMRSDLPRIAMKWEPNAWKPFVFVGTWCDPDGAYSAEAQVWANEAPTFLVTLMDSDYRHIAMVSSSPYNVDRPDKAELKRRAEHALWMMVHPELAYEEHQKQVRFLKMLGEYSLKWYQVDMDRLSWSLDRVLQGGERVPIGAVAKRYGSRSHEFDFRAPYNTMINKEFTGFQSSSERARQLAEMLAYLEWKELPW